MRLSILVVSCNPKLLNKMLHSISKATHLDKSEVEILCSWNGSQDTEKEIQNNSGYEFLISQRTPYHFARNMNTLAKTANGEILLLINDDIVLDNDSIDKGMDALINQSEVGIVGAKLRNLDNQIVHSGISFNSRNSPYHKLEGLTEYKEVQSQEPNEIVPAVTGALILIKKENFLKLKFNEMYNVCGEDIQLCLETRKILSLKILYCPSLSAIHHVSETRKIKDQYGDNSEDIILMRQQRKEFIKESSKQDLLDEITSNRIEVERLNDLYNELINDQRDTVSKGRKELNYWKKQAQTLQLNRISQSEEITRLKKDLDAY